MPASGKRANGRTSAISRSPVRSSNFCPSWIIFSWPWDRPAQWNSCVAGIELIVKQMEDVLRSLNVQPVESVGARFDPRVHEALESVDRNDLPDHQVLEEVRRGYRIRDRLLRPALVRIVNNPQQKEA